MRVPSAWFKEIGHPSRSRIGKGASPRLKRVAMKGLTITASAVCCVLLGASAPRADNSGTQKVDPAFSQAVKVYVECFGNALKSLAADPKDSAESIVTAVQAECEAEHSYAWSLLLKSAKDATFSEGFTIGLAMGVLERQLVDNATAYIVKQRAGMNPHFESLTGLPPDLAGKPPASTCDANSSSPSGVPSAMKSLLAINRFFEKQGVNMQLDDMRALGAAPPPDSGYCLAEGDTNVGVHVRLKYGLEDDGSAQVEFVR